MLDDHRHSLRASATMISQETAAVRPKHDGHWFAGRGILNEVTHAVSIRIFVRETCFAHQLILPGGIGGFSRSEPERGGGKAFLIGQTDDRVAGPAITDALRVWAEDRVM